MNKEVSSVATVAEEAIGNPDENDLSKIYLSIYMIYVRKLILNAQFAIFAVNLKMD